MIVQGHILEYPGVSAAKMVEPWSGCSFSASRGSFPSADLLDIAGQWLFATIYKKPLLDLCLLDRILSNHSPLYTKQP